MKNYPLTHSNGQMDSRYTILQDAQSGGFVLRYCTDILDTFTNYPAAVLRAVGHRAVMNGAAVFVNQPVEA